MKTPTKFVKSLTEEQRGRLQEIMKSEASQRKRIRAHAILLSDRRYSIDQIADIYQIDRDRVSQWIDRWEKNNFKGLDDDPRRGRPAKPSQKEQQEAALLHEDEGSAAGTISVVKFFYHEKSYHFRHPQLEEV
jgi:transposase